MFALAKSRKVFAELFAKSDLPLRSQGCYATSCARRHSAFLLELFFAPFVSKKSGVPNYALQNRCKPTEIKLSKPLVHFFFLKPKAQKEKVRKKKNAVLGNFAHCGERQGLCSLDSHPLAWGLLWVRCEHSV